MIDDQVETVCNKHFQLLKISDLYFILLVNGILHSHNNSKYSFSFYLSKKFIKYKSYILKYLAQIKPAEISTVHYGYGRHLTHKI